MAETGTIEALRKAWIEAFDAHDLDRHLALYRADAMLFGSTDELQIGRDAIRAYFGRRGPNVRVLSYPFPHVVMIAPDLAATAGHVEFADGERPMPYRLTWMLVREDGEWRIAQHHGSPRSAPP